MTNLDSIFKSRDITFLTKVHRRGGRERSSRGAEQSGAERRGPEAPAGPGLSRSLELGVPQEEE